MKLKFSVLGEPAGKGRPRFRNAGAFVQTYTPEKTVSYENLVRLEYRRQCNDFKFPKDTPLDVRITAYYGHGEKSVYIISGFMRLSREEAMAIRWHMGFSDNDFQGGGYSVGNAFDKFPLAVLLHIADLQATYLDETGDKA